MKCDLTCPFLMLLYYTIAITIGFTQIEYSVQEDMGILQPGPLAIVKESSRVSEQVLTINMDFIPITATLGMITF